ncbi:inner membrane protein [Desulfosporosinus acididurans]|uniref:Inner membrane protein n=1 Tax=Desulfosporosinus acididurans TaxID=476652 RepID=A0A0J1FPC3_9FIRM|nr:metal-dependent hydrolase [Desulfosporosinus acididurans]KLU65354.1 inner membrane protein [Desulfosporosinus acididurans]
MIRQIMMGKTHIAIGLAAATFTAPMLRWPGLDNGLLTFAVSAGAVVLGSLAPDLDQPGSTATKEIAGPFGKSRIAAMLGGAAAIYISDKINLKFNGYDFRLAIMVIGIILLIMAFIKHRGITHSLIGIIAAWYAFNTLQGLTIYKHYIGIPIVEPFMVGYIVHIAADFFSGGIAPLYPFVKKRIKFPVSIKTGGILDKLLIRYLALFLAIVRMLNMSNKLMAFVVRKG